MAQNSSQDSSASRIQTLQLILLGVTLLLVAILAIFFFSRMKSVDQKLQEISEEWEDVSGQITEANEQSEEALTVARRAEENANLAAMQREDADQRRRLAEQETARERLRAEEVQTKLDQIKAEQEQRLQDLEEDLSQIADTRRTALGLVLNLGSDVMKFDFDKAELKWEHKELLSRVVGILLTQEDYGVYVYGHTDAVGSDDYNLDLSLRRAQAVRDYLVQAGIDPNIITTKGFGKRRPLVKGTSPEAQAKNRRVEIGVINTRINYERSIP